MLMLLQMFFRFFSHYQRRCQLGQSSSMLPGTSLY